MMEDPNLFFYIAIPCFAFVIGGCCGGILQACRDMNRAREIITVAAHRRKNMSGDGGSVYELDLVISSVARKFLPHKERIAWLALVGEEDPR